MSIDYNAALFYGAPFDSEDLPCEAITQKIKNPKFGKFDPDTGKPEPEFIVENSESVLPVEELAEELGLEISLNENYVGLCFNSVDPSCEEVVVLDFQSKRATKYKQVVEEALPKFFKKIKQKPIKPAFLLIGTCY